MIAEPSIEGHVWHTSYDAAKRMSDALLLHQTVLSRDELLRGRYIAIALADGATDGTAYDTRADAIAAQKSDANRFIYMRIPMERLGPRTCDPLLFYGRRKYDAGYRPAGLHSRSELYIPSRTELLETL